MSLIQKVFEEGHLDFGENKVQELVEKAENLDDSIRWHFIGHLQRNKVKFIAPFVYLIHGVDSLRLLQEINKQGEKNNRVIQCLLQMHIARESSKFGLSMDDLENILDELHEYKHVKISGLMGMATNTSDTNQVRNEFASLRELFEELKQQSSYNLEMKHLSMGMSNDFEIAIQEGSNMVRIGSAIFGARHYN